MKLDARGYLTPYWNVPATVEEMRAVFVVGKNKRRAELFEKWLDYSRSLRQLVQTDYIQWVNGSFIGPKYIPGDVDVLNFLPEGVVIQLQEKLRPFLYESSREKWEVHAFVIPVPAEGSGSRAQEIFGLDKSQWMSDFSEKKIQRNSIIKKGFLELLITDSL